MVQASCFLFQGAKQKPEDGGIDQEDLASSADPAQTPPMASELRALHAAPTLTSPAWRGKDQAMPAPCGTLVRTPDVGAGRAA